MRAPSWSQRAMVATSSPHAVHAALWALGEGGTAVDAAIASDAVLGLVQPQSTGIGGDAFCLVHEGAELAGFNGSGAAPAALRLEACTAEGAWHDRSALGVTVPGVVDAWAQLSSRYGRLGLSRCLLPAIELAERGVPLGPRTASVWSAHAARLRPRGCWPSRVTAGERFGNEALAASLRAIAGGGAAAHYEGAFAQAAVAAVAAEGGVLAGKDLAAHEGEWVTPLRGAYRDHEIVELPPNGQGAAVLAALGSLDRRAAGAHGDPDWAAVVLVAIRDGMKAAYRHVADPRTADVPPFWESGRDTVYTAVAADGMCVSLISSVFMAFGSGLHAGGSPLQNRGLGFRLDPDHPNVVAGGKRPFHTIIPGMALHGDGGRGGPALVFGVVGGPMQPQGHVQVVSQLLDHGLDAQAALAHPRLQWLGGNRAGIESGWDPVLVPGLTRSLAAAGFDVDPTPGSPEDYGVGQVVRLHRDGWLEGGSDPRHDGLAAGR